MKADYEDGKARLGRGLTFHVAPSNVPVNFAFSYVFGLLAGNANLVRVPSRNFMQTEIILGVINAMFSEGIYPEIACRTAFVQYPRNDEITAFFSAAADTRIIWGGDETVRHIQRFPIRLGGTEIFFRDRYSLCLLDTMAVLRATEEELTRLVDGFYNDTYLMDQNACSSPHVVFWLGENVSEAQTRFWNAVNRRAERYDLPPVNAVEKLTRLFSNYMNFSGIFPVIRHSNKLWRAELSWIPENLSELRGRFGLFYEKAVTSVEELTPFINRKFQTVTCFGMDAGRIVEILLAQGAMGVDRITKVGEALNIGVIWDGYDIIKTLSRVIDVSF
ncbi:MAG: acyl-CoA reductase [Planctomycetia bacterium]|nr:acyl-CoA reductase [Planctomycetia bacterium]